MNRKVYSDEKAGDGTKGRFPSDADGYAPAESSQ